MTEASWLGRQIEVEIGDVAHGGHCVARAEGRVIFVRHGLPGEIAIVDITEDNGKSFCRGDVVEVLKAAPQRVEPSCAVAGPGLCGGCDWQHAEPELQRELKGRVVSEQLRRLAGIERVVEVEALPGGPLGWRSRVRLVAGGDGRAGLRAHRGHRVIPLESCPISVPGALDLTLSRKWRPGSEIEVTKDGKGRLHRAELTTVRGRTSSRQLEGSVAMEHAAGRDWRLDSHGFWQVHPAAADIFAGVIRDWAAAPEGGTAWDLYAGVGLFASVLADQVGPEGTVVAVESGYRAVADGKRNLSDLPQVRWQAGRVEHVISTVKERPDVVVLDPPRKGAGKSVVETIVGSAPGGSAGSTGKAPSRVIYVACDPAALARDVATFGEYGYRLTELRAFDAFPMTHHVECIALLTNS